MHDTAFQIGTLALNTYADLQNASILEIGAQSVNGSLRTSVLPTTKYLGVDIEEGEGVDLIVEPGKPLPLEDNSFDFVMATSVFEHDPLFWMTFLEMCRVVKRGGYVYINAPSNGWIHRYPQDNWRFYPDAGRALTSWAVSQGYHMMLVESFIADRDSDIWNDFVAVFHKGQITRSLPNSFLYENFPSANVHTWRSTDIIKPAERTEDMRLLGAARTQQEDDARSIANLSAELDTIRNEKSATEQQLSVLGEVRMQLELREQELAECRDEVTSITRALEEARSDATAIEGELGELRTRLNAEMKMAEKLDKLNDRYVERLDHTQQERDHARSEILDMKRQISELNDEVSENQNRLDAHFHETGALSELLLDSRSETDKLRSSLMHMRDIQKATLTEPRWWTLVGHSTRQRLRRDRLSRLGVFDGGSYLRLNPDVADAKQDPLHHYLEHGLVEGRAL